MIAPVVRDSFLLFFVAACGWGLFALLHIPSASMLGALALVGALKITGCPLPPAPGYFSHTVMILLGFFIGTKITKDTLRGLKLMIFPAVTGVIWALSLMFLLGIVLYALTPMDLYTAMLSSSVGGLPEMTIVALATGANVTVIVVIQTFRMVFAVVAFPLIAKKWLNGKQTDPAANGRPPDADTEIGGSGTHPPGGDTRQERKKPDKAERASSLGWLLVSLCIAVTGGYLFNWLRVPAGFLIGSLICVAAASMAGVPVKALPKWIYNCLLLVTGITVADHISYDSVTIMLESSMILIILIVTFVTCVTSVLIAYIIHRGSGWDFPTSFLAAAPGGFTVMTLMAIDYELDSFRVSLLHLCRLTALSTLIPLAFMYLPNLR